MLYASHETNEKRPHLYLSDLILQKDGNYSGGGTRTKRILLKIRQVYICVFQHTSLVFYFFSLIITWDVTPKTAGLTVSSPSRRFHKAVKKRTAFITRPLQSNRALGLNHNAVTKRQALITRPSQYCVQNTDIAPNYQALAAGRLAPHPHRVLKPPWWQHHGAKWTTKNMGWQT